ncbi:MAG: peptidase M22 [Clostridia bacterium]|nr:peptidase M22 [Clostridia bacterium]
MAELFLGVDSSNYTTSVAVCADGEILANLKRPLPVKAGERGLRQSDAVFAHVKNFPSLMEELAPLLRSHTVTAVACSTKPRDAEDSYMPCFLAGQTVASALCAAFDCPMIPVSHQNGHIMAAAYSADALALLDAPFGAFHVSGGTTEVLYVSPSAEGFSVRLVGETADLNAGQLIDRVGVTLGLSFPCGPALERLAAEADLRALSRPKISVKGCICNLSGAENQAAALFSRTGDRALTVAYVMEFIARTLEAMRDGLRAEYPNLPIVFAGGVMSNRMLQARLAEPGPAYFAAPAFSADNAAGVALLGYRKMQQRRDV